jgi:hypothetical protein
LQFVKWELKEAAELLTVGSGRKNMRRLMLCLPVCLVFISGLSSREPQATTTFEEVPDNGGALPSEAAMERLAKNDPIAFVQACVRRYDREVKGYAAELRKQERIDGQLQRSELIDVSFREDPFSVLMKWKEGAQRASALLFVKGENGNQLLVRPAGVLAIAGVVVRDPYGTDARKGGRYPLPEFGIKIGMQRALTSWEKARKDNALHVEFLGTKRIKEAGDRLCWVLKRTGYKKPEEDGIAGFTMFVDKETWLQVGTILKNDEGQLIGEYFFRDVKLNPDFPPGTFTREALKR